MIQFYKRTGKIHFLLPGPITELRGDQRQPWKYEVDFCPPRLLNSSFYPWTNAHNSLSFRQLQMSENKMHGIAELEESQKET